MGKGLFFVFLILACAIVGIGYYSYISANETDAYFSNIGSNLADTNGRYFAETSLQSNSDRYVNPVVEQLDYVRFMNADTDDKLKIDETLGNTTNITYETNYDVNYSDINFMFVPYTGANANLDLGAFNVTANTFFGDGSNLTGLLAVNNALKLYHYGDANIVITPDSAFDFNVDNGEIEGYNGVYTDVVIPYEIDGVAVVSIGERAFHNVDTMVTLHTPKTLLTIGERSFFSCSNLVYAYFPSLITISDFALGSNVSMEYLEIPLVESIGAGSVGSNISLVSLNLPSVKTINNGGFSNCSSLTSLFFSSDVPSVGIAIFNLTPNVVNYIIEFDTKGWGSTLGGEPVVLLDVLANDGVFRGDLNVLSGNIRSNCYTMQDGNTFCSLNDIGAGGDLSAYAKLDGSNQPFNYIESLGDVNVGANVNANCYSMQDGNIFCGLNDLPFSSDTNFQTFGFSADDINNDLIIPTIDTNFQTAGYDFLNYVPYTGATSDVNLGSNNMSLTSGFLAVGNDEYQINRGGNLRDAVLKTSGEGGIYDTFAIERVSDFGVGFASFNRALGTIDSKLPVNDGKVLGRFVFRGWDGATYVKSAQFGSNISGTPATDFMPSNLIFATTDSFGELNSNLTIESSGQIMTRTDLNVLENIYQDGNYFGNQIYGEMYNKNDSAFSTLALITPDVYMRLKDLNAGYLNGFIFIDSNLIAEYDGVYKINFTSSLDSSNNGELGAKIFINDVGQNNCYAHKDFIVNKTNDLTLNCFISVNVGDIINVQFDDHANPTATLSFYSANFNIERKGNK